jgi:hypothetical protein
MSGRLYSLPQAVLTIGHSNRPLDEFLRLLQAHGVTLVVDVRKMPGSRRNPQFGRDTFPMALQQAGLGYLHMPGLGGLWRRRPDSPNTGWKNASFQGYADYMLTPEFESSLQELLKRVAERQGGPDVRRGGALALPPLLNPGCPGSAGRRRRTHPRRLADRAAHAATLGLRAGTRIMPPKTVTRMLPVIDREAEETRCAPEEDSP